MKQKYLISLIASIFFLLGGVNLVLADTGTYTAYYSSDHQFRITGIYFNSSNVLSYDFLLNSSSDKTDFVVPVTPMFNGLNQIVFSDCSGSVCTGFGSEASHNYASPHNVYCDNLSSFSTSTVRGTNVYLIPKGTTITCHSYDFQGRYTSNINNPTGITKQDLLNNSIDLENTQKYLNEVFVVYQDGSESDYQVTGTNPAIFSSAFSGVCGSDNGLTLSATPTNLCSIGTASSLTWDPYSSPNNWSWWCYGSNSSTSIDDEFCLAYASNTYNKPEYAQCGYSNGSVSTVEPTGTQACLSGIRTSLVQNPDNSWSWNCTGSVDQEVSCSTLATAPIIPEVLPSDDSLSCNITPTDLSSIGDCLASVAKWLFLPHQESLDQLFNLRSLFFTKMPWGYINAFQQQIALLSNYSASSLTLTMNYQGNVIPIVDFNSLHSQFPQFFDFTMNFMNAMLWIFFVVWCYDLGRNIFAHRQLTLGI